MKKTYHILGLMSGSSLDGLDLALCRFDAERQAGNFHLKHWDLLQADTLPLSDKWQARLRELPAASGFDLSHAHAAFGHYLGSLVLEFCEIHGIDLKQIDLIASHGHTIFHEPALGFTLQIGDGAALAAVTGYKVACDFRSSDVALGGQGAPLAPMADKMLFPGFDFYLNLGGIANITGTTGGRFVAFDVTGANQVLNALARLEGKPYDKGGELASKGYVDAQLMESLNALPYFQQPYPKSLSNQWVQERLVNLCLQAKSSVADRLHTVCHHIAFQLHQAISFIQEKEGLDKERCRMLATGGGAFNHFLIDCISEHCYGTEVIVPARDIVNFKEACLMALLGLLRLEGAPNCLSLVTGASKDAVGGAVYCGNGEQAND